MKKFKAACAVLVAVFFITSCKKNISVETTQDFSKTSSSKTIVSAIAPVVTINFDSLKATLPSTANARFKKSTALLLKQNPEFAEVIARAAHAIDAAPCSTTPLNTWLNNQLLDWDSEVYYYAILTGMLNLPTYDALYFENTAGRRFYGVNGEHTQTYDKAFKDLKRFWNIQSGDMITVPIHGSMLQNRDKLIRVNKLLYGEDEANAAYWADFILWLLANVPQYRNGNHPVFSFNAYSQASLDFYPFGTIPPKIALGDGIVAPYVDLGFGDVAPQAIFAHEYGHQVQFQNEVFSGGTADPEFTRRTELMADGFAAYYLSHARGASMQWKRVQQFLQVFYNLGDCYLDSYTHHGTPAQRMAAAEWGYRLADNAQKQGHILTSIQFIALFDANLPEILGR